MSKAGAPGKNGDGAAPAVGVCTSLPILWAESDDIRDFLNGGGPEHWAVRVLRSAGPLVPLDSLADAKGGLPLPRDGILVLAQPRPLSPQENVALDEWVRAGGRVLLFADPMLTAHSIFALGDPRRPQDIAMLSPILARWGLVLEFDEAQPAGERIVKAPGGGVPVNLQGRYRTAPPIGGAPSRCALEAEGFVADCKVGAGRVVALADAALLEEAGNSGDARRRSALLEKLLQRALGR